MIKISRPEARNCVNRATAAELYEAFQDLNSSDGADVGVLCGEGGAFCAGYDLKELASFSAVPPDALQYTKGGPSPMVGTGVCLLLWVPDYVERGGGGGRG